MSAVDLLVEPLQYEFVVRALLATTVAAVVCALLSCWLVLVGWSLMGDAVSHAVLPGVVVAYVVGAPFAVGALAAGGLAVALIGVTRSRVVREDAAIGIVFTTLFALGLVLVSVTPSHVDLGHVVFGDVLGVSTGDLVQIGVLGALAAGALLLRRRDLVLWASDPAHAHVIGLRPRRLSALLLAVLALTTVVALQVVGVVLVVALLIIPGATARLLTDRFSRMLVVAPLVAAAAAVTGLYVSYWWDTAPGGTVVVVQGAVFAVVRVATALGVRGARLCPPRRRGEPGPLPATSRPSRAAPSSPDA